MDGEAGGGIKEGGSSPTSQPLLPVTDGEAGGGTKEDGGSPVLPPLHDDPEQAPDPFSHLEDRMVFEGLSETACQGNKCTVYDLLKAIGENGIPELRKRGIKKSTNPPRRTVTRDYALSVATKIGASSTAQKGYKILKSVEADLQKIEIPFGIMFYTEFNKREKALAAAADVIEDYVKRNANIEKNDKSQNTLGEVFVGSRPRPEDIQERLKWCLDMGRRLLEAVPHKGDTQRNKDPDRKFLNYQRLASLVPLLRILEIQESILDNKYSRNKRGENPPPDYYDKEGRLLAYWYNFFAKVMGSEAAPEQLDHDVEAGGGTKEGDSSPVLAPWPDLDVGGNAGVPDDELGSTDGSNDLRGATGAPDPKRLRGLGLAKTADGVGALPDIERTQAEMERTVDGTAVLTKAQIQELLNLL